MCFVHVLLNAIDLHERGGEGLIVMEEAVKLIPEMSQPGHFLSQFYQKASYLNLIVGACRSGVDQAESCQRDQSGRYSVDRGDVRSSVDREYIEQGYRVITF